MALVYLDDMIVYGTTFEEHNRRLEPVLDALRRANLRIKPQKCFFGFQEVLNLGHVISKDGIKPDPAKLEAVDADFLSRKPGSPGRGRNQRRCSILHSCV